MEEAREEEEQAAAGDQQRAGEPAARQEEGQRGQQEGQRGQQEGQWGQQEDEGDLLLVPAQHAGGRAPAGMVLQVAGTDCLSSSSAGSDGC